MSGEITKLKIFSYSDPEFKNLVQSDNFTVQLNPENYKRNFKIEYGQQQAPGSSGRSLKFVKIEPQTIDLEFLFDHTGAVEVSQTSDIGVDEDINRLKKAALVYDGKIHRPRYLKISWGNLLFKGCLETLDITYQLFKPDGTPLRAMVKAGFKEFSENELMVRKQNDNSPDLTHVRIVRAGDTLPHLANEIYGDPRLYLEVARANDIVHFRELEAGSRLAFPPIAK